MGNQDPFEHHGPMALAAPAPNLHFKCPIFSAKIKMLKPKKNYSRGGDLFILMIQLILLNLKCSDKNCAQNLRYKEGQVLELFRNTLPTRIYYLLFGIQNPREVVESVKRVMTNEKNDNKLKG